jgi:hypothetical protein
MMPSAAHPRKPFLLASLVALTLSGVASAQPPAPKQYNVQIRYQILAPRDQYIAHYKAMLQHLKSVGFKHTPGEDDESDPSLHILTGTLSSDTDARQAARKLLDNLFVKAILLTPPDFKLPADPEQMVRVQMQLASGLPPRRQRELFDQTLVKLGELKVYKEDGGDKTPPAVFQEAIGYDHRNFTRMVGLMPAGQLEALLFDLREQPAGWLTPIIPVNSLPVPLRYVSPVLLTEVLGVSPASKELKVLEFEEGKEYFAKVSPGVRKLDKDAKRVRLEVILAVRPDDADRSWRKTLVSAAPGVVLEGRLGEVVTLSAPAAAVGPLAKLSLVSTVRLPHSGQQELVTLPGFKTDNAQALKASGLEALHKKGHRGKKVRLAIVDGDFRGYEKLIASKRLPATTRYVDLTRERNRDLAPDPFHGNPAELGHGPQSALAAVLAAPDVELTLVRVDPATPFQLRDLMLYLSGEAVVSESLKEREDELEVERFNLEERRKVILAERREVLEDFGMDESKKKFREAFFKKEAQLEADQKDHRQRLGRLTRLQEELLELKGIQIVSSSLIWDTQYPLGSLSPLNRFIDLHSFPSPPDKLPLICLHGELQAKVVQKRPPFLWFQSAGNTRGQSWAGLLQDSDGNGVLEFAPPGSLLKKDRWTSELNFLAWQPYTGAMAAKLPAKARVRVTLQWSEPHEPDLFWRPGRADFYRNPLAQLRLQVLRQLEGDFLEAVAHSVELPQRLENRPSYSVYEQAVEFTVDEPGPFALRVQRRRPEEWVVGPHPVTGRPGMWLLEGLVPTGILPLGEPSLPITRKSWELRPRIFVEVVDGVSRRQGRAVFADYRTDAGSMGVPGGARNVITVGATDFTNQPRPYSATGSPPGEELLRGPDVLTYDGLDVGSGAGPRAYGANLATPFAAGTAAAILSSGTTPEQLLQHLRKK